jgi:hypothetical protein
MTPPRANWTAPWTYIYGAISFERYGHLVGAVEEYDVWFNHQVDRLVDMIEL